MVRPRRHRGDLAEFVETVWLKLVHKTAKAERVGAKCSGSAKLRGRTSTFGGDASTVKRCRCFNKLVGARWHK